MKKTINCKICGKEIGWYDNEQRIINTYPSKDECDTEHVGRRIVTHFTGCMKSNILN